MCLDDFAFRKYVLNVIIVNTKTSVFMTKDQILIRKRERERERERERYPLISRSTI